MQEIWFRESLIFRFIFAFLKVIEQSSIFKWTSRVGVIFANSKLATIIDSIEGRPFNPNGSIIYRFLNYINLNSTKFRYKMTSYLKESWLFKVLSNSKIMRITDIILIPLIAFYPFIDELGRKLFPQFTAFSYWDEAYLIFSALYVFLVWFFRKQDKPLVSTPAGPPMLLLIAVAFVLYVTNTTFPELGFAGFRVVVQYMIWFYILNSYLSDDNKAYLVARLLVYAGGIMGVHGLLQYILRVPTPAHWTDAAEGRTTTRVFSIVESPNILGSIFILMIPLCLAFVLQNKHKFNDRLIFFVLFGAMGLSLLFTLSRGAWLGVAIALFIFCIAINPRWLVYLGLGGAVMLMVPSVMSRIAYMLSPDYFLSSMTGGRIMRYELGWQMFKEFKWTGVGLGHFGGAVAMNNKHLVPETFYMDNYWLKTAVEMGIVGIVAFAILMIVLVLWSVRAVKQSKDFDTKLITAAGLAGMCGVIAHNLLENVFEVPYMVAYFWVIAALVFYFGFRAKRDVHLDSF